MSLGPVQDFIAQARRTRDLWFGSHVLSVLCQKAAAAARERQAELIIPAVLEGQGAAPGVPNKLLVLVREGEPRAVAQAAREAARVHLREWGWKVWQARSQLVDPEARDATREQLDTFLEFHAAWSPFSTEAEYPEALRRAEAALAERKRLRAFVPWARQRGGVHKSSLDGARESVLKEGGRRGGDWERFRIGQREQLDAIGLLKRTGGEPGQFIPVPTIGLAAYTALAKAELAPALESLTRECERLCRRKVLTAVQAGGRAWVRDFPFDAQLLLPGRWRTHLEEQGLPRAEADGFGRVFVSPLLRALGEPFPYVACLVADGDRMGETLQALAPRGHEAHQGLSRALSGFAAEARRIIEEKHRGVLVYAGGDDVLAFVCLPDALRCAAGLHQAFSAATRGALAGTDVKPPTLSVGLGVGHVLESLGDLLSLGRRTEALAKGRDRDGLALLARLHSSRERAWRGRWPDGPVEALEAAVTLREEGRLPLKKLQEVGMLLRRMPPGDGPLGGDVPWGRVLVHEVSRILGRVEVGTPGAGLTPARAGLALEEGLPLGEVHARVEAWAERVWLAELLARAKPRLRGDTGGGA
jgi:CRISPR-associated protein Cmr2